MIFNNAEPIDLNFIRLMGASVKSESAIGYFGTGLKFAIAVLLRTGHSVAITVSGVRYDFSARQQSLRGKDFQIVYMNDEPLGFTTDLGRNWQTWMAFREIYSNMLDEQGWIGGEPGGTSIEITGPEIDKIYARREEFFIGDRKLIAKTEHLEFYDGASSAVFYRGVRVHQTASPAPYTVNLLSGVALTEDRTLANTYSLGRMVGTGVAKLEDRAVIDKFLADTELEQAWEIYYQHAKYSATFKAAALDALQNGSVSLALRKIARDLFPERMIYSAVEISAYNQQLLQKSLAFLRTQLQITIDPAEIIVVENLEGATKAAWDSIYKKIILTPACFRLGEQYLTRVLYEEYLHKAYDFQDESRTLQNFLFEKLIEITYEHAAWTSTKSSS